MISVTSDAFHGILQWGRSYRPDVATPTHLHRVGNARTAAAFCRTACGDTRRKSESPKSTGSPRDSVLGPVEPARNDDLRPPGANPPSGRNNDEFWCLRRCT